MTLLNILLTFIGILLIAYAIYWFVLWVMRQRSAEMIGEVELSKIIRKVQLIDVREHADYKANHILGARNIPSTQFKMRLNEIRSDQPVVLYDFGINSASRCANLLRKANYSDVYILQGGMEGWNGKTKSDL